MTTHPTIAGKAFWTLHRSGGLRPIERIQGEFSGYGRRRALVNQVRCKEISTNDKTIYPCESGMPALRAVRIEF